MVFRSRGLQSAINQIDLGRDIESTSTTYCTSTQNQSIPFTSVRASRGKIVRAEPISALYEQNRVHHVGVFKELEEQMCQFTGNGIQYHDDRVDALVWAITSLQNSGRAVFNIS